jgi:hypothetical protein
MTGAEAVGTSDASATACGLVEIRSDGQVRWSMTGTASWTDTVDQFHIHRGATGVIGPIEVELLGTSTFDPVTRTATGTVVTTPALAAEIAGNPAGFYLNVHTPLAPAGIARGQLRAFTDPRWHAVLLGTNQPVVATASARGAASFSFTSATTASFVVAVGAPGIGAVTAATVHLAPAGVTALPLLDLLAAPGATIDTGLSTLSGTLTLSFDSLTRLLVDPSGVYVQVTTAAAPLGLARGQLSSGPEALTAAMTGVQETSVVNPAASAGAAVFLDTFTSGSVMLALDPATAPITAVTEAAIRAGALGVDGPVVVNLLAGLDYVASTPSFSSEGSIAFDMTLYTRLLADPAGFHVDVRTAAASTGLARGQLTQRPVSVFGALSGAEETVVVDATASGTFSLLATSPTACTWSLRSTNPDPTLVLDLHVHDGLPGTDGPALIDLLAAGDAVADGDALSGSAVITGRTVPRLLAVAGHFYANAHTADAPLGEMRGQLVLRNDFTAPAGLTYSTPVTYFVGTAIAPNDPSSTGGAVALYTVSPALPAGLSLDASTGRISGTPTAQTAAATYTVTASNAIGSTNAGVNITVTVPPPLTLSYTTPVSYVTGTAITPLSPTSTGGPITTYGVSPALPAGLSLHAGTGVLSGTPTAVAAAADYTITGSNVSGSAQAVVNITVTSSLLPPSGLTYSTPHSFPTGTAITPLSPTVGGGAVATWSISPALPAGLVFSTTNGVISGTPTATAASAGYTVTAANASGSSQFTITITVTLGAPTISYAQGTIVGYIGTSIGTVSPTMGGGAAASFSISPALPSGLSFNTANGDITGTPTSTYAYTAHTVTATNATGSGQTIVYVVVY